MQMQERLERFRPVGRNAAQQKLHGNARKMALLALLHSARTIRQYAVRGRKKKWHLDGITGINQSETEKSQSCWS